MPVADSPSSTRSPQRLIVLADRVSWSRPDNVNVLAGVSVSFGVERIGLVGANGIGKSTLARILAGVTSDFEGSVRRDGAVAYLPQDLSELRAANVAGALGVGDTLAALERVESGSTAPADLELADDAWDLPGRVAACLRELGLGHLSLDAPLETLSGGELTRIALGGLLLERPDFLILDEPTNNLDAPSRNALCGVIKRWKGGVLVISHDRSLLMLMDRIIEMTPSGLRHYGGNYELYVERRDAEQATASAAVDEARKQRRQVKRDMQRTREKQEQRAKSGRKARKSGSHPKTLYDAMKAKAEATSSKLGDLAEKRIESANARLDDARGRIIEEHMLDIDLTPVGLPAGKTVLELESVSFSYEGDGDDQPLLKDIDLRMVGPARLAITGPNGCGKTTLLKLITGDLTPTAGAVRIGASRVALLDQRLSVLEPDRSILENFRRLNQALSETTARHTLARFLFRNEDVHRPPEVLSGGERLRAALACVLCAVEPPELLILDEPTNHLDLNSLANVEAAMRAYDGALLVVSHDAVFLKGARVNDALELGARE